MPVSVNRIALVNPQLSTQVESILVRMAQSGQLRGRVTEQQLIGLLDQADGQQSASTAKKGAILVRAENRIILNPLHTVTHYLRLHL